MAQETTKTTCQCNVCSASLKVAVSSLGKRLKCPKCGVVFIGRTQQAPRRIPPTPLSAGESRIFKNSGVGGGAISFSPDSCTLLAGLKDGPLSLLDVATGLEIRTLKGHTQTVQSLAFSPDGRLAVSADHHTARLWDVESGIELRSWKSQKRVLIAASIPSDGWRVLAAFLDGSRAAKNCVLTIKQYNIHSGQTERTIQIHVLDDSVRLAFSPDGYRALIADVFDQNLNLSPLYEWDLMKDQKKRDFGTNHGCIFVLAYLPDGHYAVTGGNGLVRLWDFTAGKLLQTLKRHYHGVTCIAFSPESRRVATHFGDKMQIHVWDVETGVRLEAIRPSSPLQRPIEHAAFSPDGRHLATEMGALALWGISAFQAQEKPVPLPRLVPSPVSTPPVLAETMPSGATLCEQSPLASRRFFPLLRALKMELGPTFEIQMKIHQKDAEWAYSGCYEVIEQTIQESGRLPKDWNDLEQIVQNHSEGFARHWVLLVLSRIKASKDRLWPYIN